MGMFLANNGLGEYVFWFYTVQGLVSIVMPALIGIVADRWIPAQMTLSLCHILAIELRCRELYSLPSDYHKVDKKLGCDESDRGFVHTRHTVLP